MYIKQNLTYIVTYHFYGTPSYEHIQVQEMMPVVNQINVHTLIGQEPCGCSTQECMMSLNLAGTLIGLNISMNTTSFLRLEYRSMHNRHMGKWNPFVKYFQLPQIWHPVSSKTAHLCQEVQEAC